MNYTFNNSSIVSVNSGTIVLNVSGKTRTFVGAKLVSAVDGKIVLDLPEAIYNEGNYLVIYLRGTMYRPFIVQSKKENTIYYHVSNTMCGLSYYSNWSIVPENPIRNATSEEIQELNDQLAAEGKQWNPDTMQIETLRWKPEDGQIYYYIAMEVTTYVSYHTWRNDDIDNSHYQVKNCFKTEEEAKAVAEKIKKLLLEV